MSLLKKFMAYAEANPDEYAYCIEELKAFLARIEPLSTSLRFDDLAAARISRAERLEPGDVTELSVGARMAVLLAFAEKSTGPGEHTSGPWEARPDNENPFSAWSVYGQGPAGFICQTSGNCIANALRIVACVNACDGLSSDALAGGWTAKGMNAYAKSLERKIAELEAGQKDGASA